MASSTTDDWQLHKSVLESNKYMLDNQLFCDTTFVFGGELEKVKSPISFRVNFETTPCPKVP